ncbi:MAG: tetratricopeptide repeat protein [bacterium]|nr:tetratricopeptide repeat protein [Candidatus Sumerlaeota bacterium]
MLSSVFFLSCLRVTTKLLGCGTIAIMIFGGRLVEAQPSQATTSVLGLLQQVPRVEFDESGQPVPAGTAAAPAPTPSTEPQSPPTAVPMGFVRPAPGETPNAVADETPVARLVPERAQPAQRPGLVRGLIRAIPFVGPRIAGTRESRRSEKRQTSGENRGRFDNDLIEEPSIPPPVLYPHPGEEISVAPTTASQSADMISDLPRAGSLGVVTTSSGISAGFSKMPAVSETHPLTPPVQFAPEPQPAPASPPAVKTPSKPDTGIFINPGAIPRPAAARHDQPLPGAAPVIEPQPDDRASAPTPSPVEIMTRLAASAAPAAPTVTPPPARNIQLDPLDLAMPKPGVEENEMVRMEYINAIEAAKSGRSADAARMLRDYAQNHPSSRLALRALYVSIIIEPDAQKTAAAFSALEKMPNGKPYLEELKRRGIQPGAVSGADTLPADPQAAVDLLEKELSRSPGGAPSVTPRRKLGALYIQLKQYDRALAQLDQALMDARGMPEEPDVLYVLAECRIGLNQRDEAMAALREIVGRFPGYAGRSKARLNIGLIYEDAGDYQKARAMYRVLIEENPAASEAVIAQERLRDLNRL